MSAREDLTALPRMKYSTPPARPDEPSSNSALLTRIFLELESRDVSYCLLRNFEELPEKAYGDVDILVRKVDLPTVEKILTQSLADSLFLFKKLEKSGHIIYDVSSRMEIAHGGFEPL